LNNICIMGNVGQVRELRYATSGAAILGFSVAVNRRYKGEDETTWFNCTSFAKLAEMLGEHLTKGAKVAVTGRMVCNKWQDREGNNRDSWELIVNEFHFAGPRVAASEPAEPPARGLDPGTEDGPDDDIPF